MQGDGQPRRDARQEGSGAGGAVRVRGSSGLTPVTFCTVSDARFFVGTAALVNSLRITGNDDRVVILDSGLTEDQRARLNAAVGVETIAPPGRLGDNPLLSKPFPALLDLTGTVVAIDSDMLVTRSLAPVLQQAAAGKVCVIADIPDQRERWSAHWSAALGLQAPLRREEYVNAGFLACSVDHWPELLQRWREGCATVVGSDTMTAGGSYAHPFWAADQDVLNALLMSEVPAAAKEILEERLGPSPSLLPSVTIVDRESLSCRIDDVQPFLLHYWGGPKPWERSAWRRVQRDAYVELLPRALLADDVAVPIAAHELPPWLRPGAAPALARTVLGGLNRSARALLARLPAGTGARIRDGLRSRQ